MDKWTAIFAGDADEVEDVGSGSKKQRIGSWGGCERYSHLDSQVQGWGTWSAANLGLTLTMLHDVSSMHLKDTMAMDVKSRDVGNYPVGLYGTATETMQLRKSWQWPTGSAMGMFLSSS
jgi:hypothetical protein